MEFGYSHETQAVSALIAGLKHRKVDVRIECVWALSESDDPRAPGALKEATDDPDKQVRSEATVELGRVQSRQSATHPASK